MRDYNYELIIKEIDDKDIDKVRLEISEKKELLWNNGLYVAEEIFEGLKSAYEKLLSLYMKYAYFYGYIASLKDNVKNDINVEEIMCQIKNSNKSE